MLGHAGLRMGVNLAGSSVATIRRVDEAATAFRCRYESIDTAACVLDCRNDVSASHASHGTAE